ncbi:hypothetical protein CUR178_05467 [Leishmania enriettii]|uniref:SET domain-containing protein n=1 Tax=Leishmania enriettii TaxID=5663 RepID=A0A836HJ49_LEIEN|nr:hypothetical protein CUR178_05467 [Leishmania enriettii]
MESCFALAYSSKEEAGRHAVARRHISPGELVLAAAPYGLVLNPSHCPSALYLSSRATSEESAAAITDSHAGRSGKLAKRSKSNAGKKAVGRGGGSRANGTATASAAVESVSASHYIHALQDEDRVQGVVSAMVKTRWYTTTPTRCSVCFQEIPAGRWLCNRGSLAELAMDMTQEQEALDRDIEAAEERAAGAGGASRGNKGGDDGASNGAEASAAAAAAFRKLKKPFRSSEARKDGAVELKQRMLVKALALKAELLFRRQLQRRRRAEEGLPVVRLEGWEVPTSSSHHAVGTACDEAAMSGCSSCGVLCYCSEACWRAYREGHEQSGECAVLRGLYPRLMAEYYAMGAASSCAGVGHGSGASSAPSLAALPGDEPLHWARSTSESRMLEFQSLLFSAIVATRAYGAGYQSNLATAAGRAEGCVTGHAAAPYGADDCAAPEEAEAQADALDEQLLLSTADVALPSRAVHRRPGTQVASTAPKAVHSVVIPKEALSIEAIRAKAGLTGKVEVLDADPELRRIARGVWTWRDDLNTASRPDDSSDSPAAETCGIRTVNAALVRSFAGNSTIAGGAGEGFPPKLTARAPLYAEFAQMETNLSVISKQHRSTYQRYYRAFAKRVLPVLQQLLLHHRRGVAVCDCRDDDADAASRTSAPHGEGTGHLLQVSELYFQRLCAVAQCNSFGLYDKQDNCIGFGIYREASYFNHSCVPNLCRVMHQGSRLAAFYTLRAIAPQETLSICYTDVEQLNSAERRRNLLRTYRFFCMCERCSGNAEGPQMAIVAAGSRESAVDTRSGCAEVSPAVFEKPLLLCGACAIHGYLRPLPPPSSGFSALESDAADTLTPSWTMQEVQVRQCTVCRTQVVREASAAAPTLGRVDSQGGSVHSVCLRGGS